MNSGAGGMAVGNRATEEEAAATPLLRIRGLRVSYRTSRTAIEAVRGVDLTIRPGEVVALVGESGSGKSTIAHAIMGMLPGGARLDAGRIEYEGEDIAHVTEKRLRSLRGRAIGLIPQDPRASLNPVMRVGRQVAEALLVHDLGGSRSSAAAQAVDLLAQVGLDHPALRAEQYPHEMSGGMCQRVLIAIALACRPHLIMADEPTSALDVTVQRRILDHIGELTRNAGTAMLLITHDLALAADRAQRIAVMSGGQIVEQGLTRQVLRSPAHPYTSRLLLSAPSLSPTYRTNPRAAPQPTAPSDLLVVDDIVKDFHLPGTGDGPRHIRAVDHISFHVRRGETFAVVGESGSGKSTMARMLLRLTPVTAGRIVFDDEDVTDLHGERLRRLRQRIQLIYQNPYTSLQPRFTVREIVEEPLRSFRRGGRAERCRRVSDLIEQVALPSSVLRRKPAELSGGQRQRVAIARALALEPELVVCDEAVSALDVSVQAQILDLLVSLQNGLGLSYVFISHDLAVVRKIADRVAVMRAGRIVETGTTESVLSGSRHPYTRELLAAVPGAAFTS